MHGHILIPFFFSTVPGPVTNHNLLRKDGITLTWGPPENRNGLLQGYMIQWIDKDNVNHSTNLTIDANHFTFPNVSTDDKINISIMAIGNTGVGIPIYVKMLNHVVDIVEPEAEEYFPWIEIGIGAFTIICLLLFCCLLAIHRKNCKKAHRNQAAASANAPMQMHSVNCNADIHEMQTLIGTSEQLPVLVPNGKYRQPEPQIPANHQQSVNTFGSVRLSHANANPSNNNPETQNGKSHLLPPNKNGLVQKATISSSTGTGLLPPQQQLALSLHVLSSKVPLKSYLEANSSSKNHDVEAEPTHSATNSNSIYRRTNSSYHNNDDPGYNVSGGSATQHITFNTGEPNQSQPIHSYRPTATTLATVAPTIMATGAISSTSAENVPSSAATSTSLSSASNFSTTSNGSSAMSSSSSCSVHSQQQPHPQQQQPQHRTVRYGSSSSSNNGTTPPVAGDGVDLTCAAAVRITENPQVSDSMNHCYSIFLKQTS